MSDDLAALRDAIDQLDAELLAKINERARLAEAVAEVKQGVAQDGEAPVMFYRPEREAQVLRRIADLNQGPIPDDQIRLLFMQIMSACLALEQPMNVGYLGPEAPSLTRRRLSILVMLWLAHRWLRSMKSFAKLRQKGVITGLSRLKIQPRAW